MTLTPDSLRRLADGLANQNAEAERVAARYEASADMLEALAALAGDDEPSIGWRGNAKTSPDHFACEFCAAEHLDCSLIPHANDCIFVSALNAIAKAEGRDQ